MLIQGTLRHYRELREEGINQENLLFGDIEADHINFLYILLLGAILLLIS